MPIGWWVGLDGSRVATVPTYKGEGAQFGKTTVDNWILTRYPSPDARQSPADFRKEFSRIQPLLASRADDAGLRKEELVKEYEGKAGLPVDSAGRAAALVSRSAGRTADRGQRLCRAHALGLLRQRDLEPVAPGRGGGPHGRDGSPRWRPSPGAMAARPSWTGPGRTCSWPSITISRSADCSRTPANSCPNRFVCRRTSPRSRCGRLPRGWLREAFRNWSSSIRSPGDGSRGSKCPWRSRRALPRAWRFATRARSCPPPFCRPIRIPTATCARPSWRFWRTSTG